MKQSGANEVLELLRVESRTDRENVVQTAMHDLHVLDMRAKYAFMLLDHWGMSVILADCMPADQRAHKKMEPNELSIRVCEVVDAMWAELLHRGWIVQDQPAGD